MTLNLVKLAVGIDDVDHLLRVQRRRLDAAAQAGRSWHLYHVTRNRPRRAEELLAGGSIYWVIKGRIRVRQRLLAIEGDVDDEGRRFCRLVLDPELFRTEAWPHRAIQGWRYLPAPEAPPDLRAIAAAGTLPAGLAEELRELGLL